MKPSLVFALFFSLSTPGAALATPQFKCHRKLKPKKSIVGKRGTYEIKRGLSVSKRSGFVERKKIKPQKGCFFSGLTSDQCVVMHFDKKAFAKAGRARMQCVLSDDPSKTLKGRMKGALGYGMDTVSGYEFVLFGPNKTGYPSSSDDNSTRTRKLKDKLAKKNLVMKSFCVPRAMTKFAKAIGKKVFCQWYDAKSDTVLFATEYTFEAPK